MSGAEIARLVLRTAVGATMIAHGMRHGRTLEGTARWLGSIGFRQPELQAKLGTVVEVSSGVALVLGAATPLAAFAVVGTMAVAARTVHAPNGFFIVDEGWEYVATLAAASVAISALGPGRFSVDRLVERAARAGHDLLRCSAPRLPSESGSGAPRFSSRCSGAIPRPPEPGRSARLGLAAGVPWSSGAAGVLYVNLSEGS